ncbi:hypothetical protein [Rhizobium leguminosarum]|uniref:hypothetical protein n=1 Tax=Rhizobium leguminosarum TaxID=384 RepID=UPI0016099353|nr:hypothetical protein [Rhizobium leguminosarum]MBB4326965.1 hypothetical protein [Rhizobium leguminosarum]MBB4352630.1 hypothetical protein [Rhizobium leguminosarum]MBB4547279.1 hypothetical protein [Rhizobium leguminosarum]MBB4559731.1 hypothetical protein [Rhizobium leguminosarum]
MPGHAKSAIIVFVCLMTVMSILPPALFGGVRGGAWKFVAEYQTLIAGAMAVAAALLTIRQMRATDRMQIANHERQINIATLPTKLAISKLMGSLPRALKHCSEKASEFLDLCDDQGREPIWNQKANFALGMSIYGYRHVLTSFNDIRFAACAPYFTADLDGEISEFTQWVETLNLTLPEDAAFIAKLFHSDDRPEWFADIMIPVLSDLAASTENLNIALEQWSGLMLDIPPPVL